MARKFRSSPTPEPAIFDRQRAAWRYRFLLRWLVFNVELSQGRIEVLPRLDEEGTPEQLAALEDLIAQWNLTREAEAFIQSLLDARERCWPGEAKHLF